MSHHADPASFRAAASRFSTGVTVVTSSDPDGAPVGMTANSFTTVSMQPPTVLVSLKRGRTWQAVSTSGRYAVNVLAASDVAICRHFAGAPLAQGALALDERGGFFLLPQAIAQFGCEVVNAVEIADHTLFIGEVRWCRHQDGLPLAFYASCFRNGLGAEIRPSEALAYPAEGWTL
ncbi:flavin reductase family protein [Bradyrhizobium sp. 83012]|uniref:Flavin reductase family protein n=1 Tax=Bradyrhizobium aeschynomenes TaxID=2734909 RepID=A0ABX2C715_9BRAD|nr:flavin reductase family protein [Bradyrhizobium aeschynomenes]NPU12987.1 flavin reductase family protein [Bradyrhizobium aeschynomenes]NPU63788.1 flavin reductase family protein [Bradyrhizobium aeschynomenes]